ncbi:MAG: DNA-binding protein WhiA [Christensenellales bacterium]|jgi:DNA-binding protein WhiA
MPFSRDVKEELAHVPVKRAPVRRAELSGLARFSGGIGRNAQGLFLSFATDYNSVAQRILAHLKAGYRIDADMLGIRREKLNKGIRYHVRVGGADAARLMRDIGLLEDEVGGASLVAGIAERVVPSAAEVSAYLRGAFMASGSIQNPDRAYHLEFVTQNQRIGQELLGLIANIDLNAKLTRRRDHYVVYLKEAEHIVELLGRMGAHKAVFEIENVRILKGIRNDINRSTNLQAANIDKSSSAAANQIRSIGILEREGLLRKLPLPLRQAADIRIEYPDATLQELADHLPGVSRSGVNHRLRRLVEMAEKLLESKEE